MGVRRKRSRVFAPSLRVLEPRTLLASGVWIGQDGSDLVGPSSAPGGDGVQDIHLALRDLPAAEEIAFVGVLGLGGGEWQFDGAVGPWRAELARTAGDANGDLYLQPYQVETGRPFNVEIRYVDGAADNFWINGGLADPSARVPRAELAIDWIGHDGSDRTGPGASVGPDGFQDARLVVRGLAPSAAITSVSVSDEGGSIWESGVNPQGHANVEVVRRGDQSAADIFFQPDRDLADRTLTISIAYANGILDTGTVRAGATEARLAVDSPAPLPIIHSGVSAVWIGQDQQDLAGPGSVHATISGLPTGRAIVGATLTNQARTSWVYRASSDANYDVEPFSLPLVLRDSDLGFPPVRDETGSMLTLRLQFDDGSIAFTQFSGGRADPGRREQAPIGSTVVVHPGDDLNDLANRFDTIRLSTGTYRLDQPLVLNRPVRISADAGATLFFDQSESADPWSAAIKIHASHTTLEGFAVRFAAPVRWAAGVSYGPAVIGTTDNLDSAHPDPKIDIVLRNLNLESPPAATSWEEAPRLIRVTSASSGRIEQNVLKGGTTEFVGGPWTIAGNSYVGTVPGTYCWTAFAGHNTRNLLLDQNTARPVAPAGKTWRFLVLTVSGVGDVVSNNSVVGIGPRDGDALPDQNASEIILTEAYRVRFEGNPSDISSDGRILRIPDPQGGAAGTGDVVAILTGSAAGVWRTIAQRIDTNTYLMDQPLPLGDYVVSIATGFVRQTFQGNTIDSRGSSTAGNLVLVGDHFGTRVADNRLYGGAQGFKITAAPTEQPVNWGWTHAPFLGGVIEGNLIADAVLGAELSVEHSAAIKSNSGRVYLSATLDDNAIAWSSQFLASQPSPLGLVIGERGGIDPGELVVSAGGNVAIAAESDPVPNLEIHDAVLDGLVVHEQARRLPLAQAPPSITGLVLLNDTGLSASDGVTRDGRLRFDSKSASSWEYRVGDGVFKSVPSPSGFAPDGLSAGVNVIAVRSVDRWGMPGELATVAFQLDTDAPAAVAGLAIRSDGQLGFIPTASADFYVARVNGGVPLALGQSTAFAPSGLAIGPNWVSVQAFDLAGNVGAESGIILNNQPGSPTGRWLGQTGKDLVGPYPVAVADGIQDFQIALSRLRRDRRITFLEVQGFGGDVWQYNGPWGPWKVAVVRGENSGTARLYLQPARREVGRPFQVRLRYDDGSQAEFWVRGGSASPTLRANRVKLQARGRGVWSHFARGKL